MASYQARTRDPLLDSKTQAMIEQRGQELIGLGLMVLAVLLSLILFSYVPEDPNWMSASDAPAQNYLGRFGASLASPLFIIIGMGSWAISLVFAVWGIRLFRHVGADRALGRVIFAPIVVALAAIYASTHVPGAAWSHSFGLGGLFGDTILGAVLSAVPANLALGLKVTSALFAAALVAMALFVLGFTRDELRMIFRRMLIGLVMIYAGVMRLFGFAGTKAMTGMRNQNLARQERRAAAAIAAEEAAQYEEAEAARAATMAPNHIRPLVVRETVSHQMQEPTFDGVQTAPVQQEETAPEPRRGLFGRLPGLTRAADPEPELVEQQAFEGDIEEAHPDRVKNKIANVIKNRESRLVGQSQGRQEPLVLNKEIPATPLVATRYTQDPATPVIPRTPVSNEYEMLDDTDDLAALDDALIEELDTNAPQEDALRTMLRQASRAVVQPETKNLVQHTPKKPAAPSKRAIAEAQPALQFEESNRSNYEMPPLGLLAKPVKIERASLSDEALEENARMLESVLDDYGVKGEIVSVRPGPVVTMYELEPAPGLKASRVIGLSDDIARSMSALSARVSTVPGRTVIGIELPNEQRETVALREILSHRDFGDGNQKLPLALGKDIGGEPIVANLAKMPHLLIAGTTGSGKSVAINTMILSLLYKLSPDECRMIMIDPKMLELSVYDGIPHLLSPVVTDPKKAVVALKWVVGEMEERYKKMSKMGVRNIDGYNGRVADALDKNEMFSRTVQTGFDDDTGEPIFETEEFAPEKLPYIVVVVDEMADLMMVAGKEIEACIQRLAQMARASGIHLIMATQRPSVDVITGTIKANFPTRISFQVTSKIDSRTILGEMGAEQLLGMGDMLYMAGGSKITRVHGPFCSDEEVEEIVNHLKAFGPPEYVGGVVDGPSEDRESSIDAVLGLGGNTDGEDALYDTAVQIVINDRKCSTSYIQRKLAIGYNKAARLVEQMEDSGLVSPANHVGKRDILIPEK
ncbi:FtsK/SpoIIIE family protein [Rhodobacteraceae bacterium HTCC2150]|nr:FtsK/SpoIIIE family protein [Rhodobacteraceae bacterium HTCC2150]